LVKDTVELRNQYDKQLKGYMKRTPGVLIGQEEIKESGYNGTASPVVQPQQKITRLISITANEIGICNGRIIAFRHVCSEVEFCFAGEDTFES